MRVLFTVFSASGNTARVCGLFAERLQERGAECVTLKIRKDAETPDVAAFDTLVIGYPVHGSTPLKMCWISQRACHRQMKKVIIL